MGERAASLFPWLRPGENRKTETDIDGNKTRKKRWTLLDESEATRIKKINPYTGNLI